MVEATMKIPEDAAAAKSKHGINLWAYNSGTKNAELVYIEVEAGHFQEFYNKKSTLLYYVIDGSGTFFLNRKPIEVTKGDMVVIKPGTKCYYLGKMRLALVSTPAWDEKDEVHVRFIEKSS